MLDDTHPAIRAMMIEHYRSLEPWQRIALVHKLNRRADDASLVGIQERHPDDDERGLRLRLAAMKHGIELIARAYGVTPASLEP